MEMISSDMEEVQLAATTSRYLMASGRTTCP